MTGRDGSERAERFRRKDQPEHDSEPHPAGVHGKFGGPLAPSGNHLLANSRRGQVADREPDCRTTHHCNQPPRASGHGGNSDDREQRNPEGNEDVANGAEHRATGCRKDQCTERCARGSDADARKTTASREYALQIDDAARNDATSTWPFG
ncbi:MAG: hypothetical protein RJB08_1933 [Actinomycetota bacterium]